MYFVEDPQSHLFYYGEKEPTRTTYRELLVDSPPKVIGIDVETISLKERIAIGISISVTPTTSYYFQLFPDASPVVPWHLLKDPSITKVIHNALFDLSALREYEVDNVNILDTSVMARLLCYKFADLVSMSLVHKMEVHDVKEYIPKGGTMLDVPQPTVAKKCMQDSMASLKLYHELYEDINKNYFSVEMQLIPILIEMSNRGLLIDQEARQKVEDELVVQSDYYNNLCREIGFNPGSPQQVSYTLAKRGAYSIFPKLPFTRGRKSLSSAEEILNKMDDPLASIVLKYREYTYLLTHYIKPWAHDERAYTRFHLNAITGRVSSTDRNMQNIPGKKSGGMVNCCNILLPDSGMFTDMDFSQIELRVLAYLSQDKEMLHVFETGGDIHQATADFLSITRGLARSVNFALVFGATDETLAETAQIKSVERAKQLRETTFELYPGVGDWISSVQYDSTRTGIARTVFGRNIGLPSLDEERLDGIHRKAVNYPIQGSAAEILKRGLIICKNLPMALQVHDEVLVDGFVPDYVFKPLENIAPFRTPVEIKYLERWE